MGDPLLKAQNYCEKNKHRYTKPRQQVLQAIIEKNAPITAYDILKVLSVEKDVKPPTIYRAIDFWSKHGFIHRVESLNAYIFCDFEHRHQGTQIMICDQCGVTKEICSDDFKIPTKIQASESFQVTSWNIEIHGICKKCA